MSILTLVKMTIRHLTNFRWFVNFFKKIISMIFRRNNNLNLSSSKDDDSVEILESVVVDDKDVEVDPFFEWKPCRSERPGLRIKKPKPEPEPKPEPDYFKDMVPKFTKPKTIYVNEYHNDCDGDEQSQPNVISKKFRIQDQQRLNMIDLDESKFTAAPVGNLDEINIGQKSDTTITWEDMADKDDIWSNTTKTLQMFRKEERERRAKEHRLQKNLKSTKNK